MRREGVWKGFSEESRWKPAKVLTHYTSEKERKLSFYAAEMNWMQWTIKLNEDKKLENLGLEGARIKISSTYLKQRRN